MEDVEELPADKRACNSQDSRTSTSSSDSSAQSQSQEAAAAAANGASSGQENSDADMDTSSSDSPSSSEGEQEQEQDREEDSDYGTCDSDDDHDDEEDPRHQELQDIQYGRSSEDQQKLSSLVSRLSEEVDPSLQLIGLTELCEVLSFCTEDSFSPRVMADTLSRVLVKLANHESNADIMLLAIRAITYLSDVYPPSVAFLVKHETLPALCQRLLTIEYLDVAEQVHIHLLPHKPFFPLHLKSPCFDQCLIDLASVCKHLRKYPKIIQWRA